MKLFWKSRTDESKQAEKKPAETTHTQPSPKKKNPLHTWWHEHCTGDVPAELEAAVRQMMEKETERRRLSECILSPTQQERTQEARRLALTKKKNIDESLEQVQKQQEWLRQYRKLTQEYDEHRNRLYEANKQLKSMSNEERELERFEAFERIQGRFLRMQMLAQQSRELKESGSLLLHQAEEQAHSEQESVKRLTQKVAERTESEVALARAQEMYGEACKVEGVRDILDLCAKKAANITARLRETIAQQTEEAEELDAQIDLWQQERSTQKALVQNLMPHRQMLEHGELIMEKLFRFEELEAELVQLKQRYNNSVKEQNTENEMLGRIYQQYQALENDIHNLNDELTIHRHNNAGHMGYALQERAMRLKIRKQQLLSAQFQWKRVWEGFVFITEKEQLVNSLRLSLATTTRNIEMLEPEVTSMRKRCHEKEYTLTLSKSQNVIQLRGDLKEGVSCTVCGATHHPYHSDTMLEQSKLLSEIRTEFDILRSELAGKEHALEELQKQYTELTVRHELERKALEAAKEKQVQDLKDWQMFIHLDQSLAGNSTTTNMEARMTMIQQLIESANREEEIAQKDLDAYNFHQARIVELTEVLSAHEQKLSELTVRLNELNTGCQVMAGRCERLSLRYKATQSAYTHLFEQLSSLITLPDWLAEWKENHETLRQHISKMMKQWNEVTEGIRRATEQLGIALAMKELSARYMQSIDGHIQVSADIQQQYETLAREAQQTLSQIVGEQDTNSYLAKYTNDMQACLREEAEAQATAAQLRTAHAHTEGQIKALEELNKQIDESIVDARSELDIWIRQYNAAHPPVQYSELQAIFEQEKDWSDVRSTVRKAQVAVVLEQEKVNTLQSRILSLKAENVGAAAPDSQTENRLALQHDALERQLNTVLMHIANLELTLKKHNDSTAAQEGEE